MSTPKKDPLLQMETTCASLLCELKIIWDEVGENDVERDRILLKLKRECLEVNRRKIDFENKCRAQLKQAIADSETELAAICSAMGERPVHIRQQINKIEKEIYTISSCSNLDETDLTLKKLEELHTKLQTLQKEKSERLNQVLDHLSSLNLLCSVLGLDFKHTINKVHPSLSYTEGAKSISDDTISRLSTAIQRLRDVKIQRMQRIQDLATSLIELWNLMDTPVEEQQTFQSVTCNIAALEEEITEPNLLSMDFINYVEAEVYRLESLKFSKLKELVFKKRLELEDVCRKTHLLPDEKALEYIESGVVDAGSTLEKIEIIIGKFKEEAFSRKDILEKVEKWMGACEEECWLEEYNRDDNRYNDGRGAHLTLKRAEKARVLVNKLPGMVDALVVRTVAWENKKGIEFTYDGVRLLSMLEDYKILRQEKEEEQKGQKDQKKLQGQLIAELNVDE